MIDVKGLNVIITGAAQGMGKTFAREFVAAGANVAICDISKDIAKTADELANNQESKVYFQVVDVSREGDIAEFVKKATAELGTIDVLVNNAAIHILHSIEEISEEEWDKVLAVNIKGSFLLSKYVLPAMRKQKFGRIINISSEAGKNGGTICGLHYAASKGAVLSFTRNLAKQVGGDGITVNAITPGRIATAMGTAVPPEENQVYIDMSVVKRLGKPEDIAYGVLFLASRKSGFITGETLNINGGTYMD